MMLENFPTMSEWLALRDKVLEKGLETGCRVMVKLSEKTMEFLELAESRFPMVKQMVEPFLRGWREKVQEDCPCCGPEDPCCGREPAAASAQQESTPAPAPAPAAASAPQESTPAPAPAPDETVLENVEPAALQPEDEPPAPAFVEAVPEKIRGSRLAEQLREIPLDLLQSIFVHNQLVKVLYLMAMADKKWLLAQEISAAGDELDFPILPQNVRKVIQQKAVDAGFVRVRERADSRRGAKEFHLTAKGESFLKSTFQLG